MITPSGVPPLSSRPGAPATLYLDFDGNVERQWGSHANVVTPPYDTDGNKAGFSAAEVTAIREIWARVAEDYAPFNINVSTIAPPLIADRVAARIAIGGSYSDWYGSSAGGVSYVGGFAGGASNVGFVFANTLSNNPRYVAEAASHEAGHLFGLEHQATWISGRLVTEYNAGTTTLAPIMGVSYYAGRSTWANGTTQDGPSAYQDELSVIASSANGFGYAPDDYGNTIASAAALPISGTSASVKGLIGRNDDRDVFKFATGGGQASFALDVAPYGPNLDAVLEIQNASGQTIVAANSIATLGSSLTKTLAAGTYYLVVHSSGGYGNLGRYTLHGSIAAASTVTTSQPVFEPPSSTKTSSSGSEPQPVTTSSRVADDGTLAFRELGSWTTLSGVGYARDIHWSPAGSGNASTWTFTGLTPGQYRVAATWPGSALNAVDAPFSVSDGTRLLSTVRVNQQHAASTFTDGGAAWQNLGTFTITGSTLTVRLNSSATGRVLADAIRLERVYSTSGGSLAARAEMALAIDAAELPASGFTSASEQIGSVPNNPRFVGDYKPLSAFESSDLRNGSRTREPAWDNDRSEPDGFVAAAVDEVFSDSGLDFDAVVS